jgi:NADPH:quinone reductase-like Zn-dependent oxidoreductase
MKKVLIIGASGMVASRFVDLAKDKLEITPVDEKI